MNCMIAGNCYCFYCCFVFLEVDIHASQRCVTEANNTLAAVRIELFPQAFLYSKKYA